MEFKCPKCGCDRLEEIMADVTVSTHITDISRTLDFDYGASSKEDGDVERYQCMGCGFTPTDDDIDINTPDGLIEWLEKQIANAPIRLIVRVDKGMLTAVYSTDTNVKIELLDTDLRGRGENETVNNDIEKNIERLEENITGMHEVY